MKKNLIGFVILAVLSVIFSFVVNSHVMYTFDKNAAPHMEDVRYNNDKDMDEYHYSLTEKVGPLPTFIGIIGILIGIIGGAVSQSKLENKNNY